MAVIKQALLKQANDKFWMQAKCRMPYWHAMRTMSAVQQTKTRGKSNRNNDCKNRASSRLQAAIFSEQ